MPFTQALQHYAERNPWNSLSAYGEFKEMKNNNELILGYKGRVIGGQPVLDYKKPVTIPFDPESENLPAFLTIGKKGSGKTTFVNNITHQLVRIYNSHCFVVDPKASMAPHKMPETKKAPVEFLDKIGFKPQGLPLKVITPYFLRNSTKYKNTDLYYAIGLSDFNKITEFSVRKHLMEHLLGINGNDGSIRKLQAVLDLNPKSIEEMTGALNKVNLDYQQRKTYVFDSELKNRIREGVISDTMSVDIVELMQSHIVVQQVSLMQTENINASYVAFALAQIKEGLESRRFNRNVALIIDEADVLAPSMYSPPSRSFIQQAYSKWRSEHVTPHLIVQNPNTVDKTPLLQVDYTFTSKIGYGPGTESDFIRSQYPSVDPFKLTDLYFGQGWPKEFAVINADQDVETFFPFPSPSATTSPKNFL